MELNASIAQQLQRLCGDSDDAERIAAGLRQLAADVTWAVPSCVSVSIWLESVGPDAPMTIGLRDGSVGPVLASLAVPQSVRAPGATVLFQAAEAGAFLLLADDLRGLLDPVLALLVDEHLHIEVTTTADPLKSSIDDLAAVNQAVGVLIARGLLPEEAHAELSRRARQDGMDTAAAGRLLLDSRERPPTGQRGCRPS